MTTSTLLVDDSPSFLESAMRFLAADKRIDIVGLAQNGREALHQYEQHRPDLVVMDWAMPDMTGLEATRHLKALPCAPRVIILTLHDSDEYRAAAAAARADGFLSKQDFGVKLLPMIEELRATIRVPDEVAIMENGEQNEKEMAVRWRRALLQLSQSCLAASQERDYLAPVMQTAMHSALEQLLLYGNHDDLLSLEAWLRDHQERDLPVLGLPSRDQGWLPVSRHATTPKSAAQ